MTKPITEQASKLWQQITAPETAETYKKTGVLTWTIVKETGYLGWLVICLGLVAGEWIWKSGYRTGWNVREWINNYDQPKADGGPSTKDLLTASKETLATRFSSLIASAREQLGIQEVTPLAPPPPAPKPVPTPTPVAPVTPAAPAPTVSASEKAPSPILED